MLEWTKDLEERFTELRQRELSGTLNAIEEIELTNLIYSIEGDESVQLTKVIIGMSSEQTAMRLRLQSLQVDNENLAKVLNQQELLVSDARKWLEEFEKRHHIIQQSYMRLTGETLVHS